MNNTALVVVDVQNIMFEEPGTTCTARTRSWR